MRTDTDPVSAGLRWLEQESKPPVKPWHAFILEGAAVEEKLRSHPDGFRCLECGDRPHVVYSYVADEQGPGCGHLWKVYVGFCADCSVLLDLGCYTTPARAAELLGVKPRTIRARLRQGNLRGTLTEMDRSVKWFVELDANGMPVAIEERHEDNHKA